MTIYRILNMGKTEMLTRLAGIYGVLGVENSIYNEERELDGCSPLHIGLQSPKIVMMLAM